MELHICTTRSPGAGCKSEEHTSSRTLIEHSFRPLPSYSPPDHNTLWLRGCCRDLVGPPSLSLALTIATGNNSCLLRGAWAPNNHLAKLLEPSSPGTNALRMRTWVCHHRHARACLCCALGVYINIMHWFL